jgi:hypothetical protein
VSSVASAKEDGEAQPQRLENSEAIGQLHPHSDRNLAAARNIDLESTTICRELQIFPASVMLPP